MEAALLALGGTTLEPTLERGGRIKSLTEAGRAAVQSTFGKMARPARDTYTESTAICAGS
jgi:hypothetical protein